MKFNNDMLNTLKKLAQDSDVNFRHAAILIKNGIVYACGYNQYVTRGTIHAELSVFLKYPKRYGSGYDIIVVRINKQIVKIRINQRLGCKTITF